MTSPSLPALWGHRGGRGPGRPPENSLAAFQAAMEGGADGIELDVFLTRDGQLVVFHDPVLEQLSDGTGRIEDQTWPALQALRLKTFDGGLSNERIPTLAQVLERVDHWRRGAVHRSPAEQQRAQRFVVNIETKGLGIAAPVAEEVRRWLTADAAGGAGWTLANFLNSSFDLASLRHMRRVMPELPVGALFAGPLPHPQVPWDLTLDELRQCVQSVHDLGASTINVTLPTLRQPGALALIRAAGAHPVAWTSGEVAPLSMDPQQRRDLLHFLTTEAVVLITDHPQAYRALLAGGPA